MHGKQMIYCTCGWRCAGMRYHVLACASMRRKKMTDADGMRAPDSGQAPPARCMALLCAQHHRCCRRRPSAQPARAIVRAVFGGWKLKPCL